MRVTNQPVKAIQKNCLINQENQIWAYFSVTPKVITQNNPQDIQNHKELLRSLFKLLSKYEDIDLVMYPQTLNLESRFEKMARLIDRKNKAVGTYYTKETVNILTYEGDVYRPAFILGVRVQSLSEAESLKEVFKKAKTAFVDEIMDLLGYEYSRPDLFFEKVQFELQDLNNLLQSYAIRPLNVKEMLYLNRLQFIRGLEHVVTEENQVRLTEDRQSATVKPLLNFKGVLSLSDDLGTTYLSFLPIAELPENMSQVDLFQFGQDLPFPCELRLKVHFPPLKGSVKMSSKVNWLYNRFKEEEQEELKAGEEPSDRLLNIRYLVRHMKQRMQNGEPVAEWLGCFVVYGKTPEETRQNALYVVNRLNEVMAVYRAKNDQVALFYKNLMGQPLGDQLHWKNCTNLEGLAELLFGTTSMLGMDYGWYIGRQDVLGEQGSQGEKTSLEEYIQASNRFVFLNPLAVAEGIKGALFDAPHIAVTGKTGKGKTFLVGLIFLYSSFLEVQSLFIDPKGEKRRWFHNLINNPYYQEHYPLFVAHLKSFNYVTLNAQDESNYGVLDPITYLDDTNAKQVAQDMIDELSPLGANFQLKGAVLEGIQEILKLRRDGYQVGLMNVIECLESHNDKQVSEYGKFLRLTVEHSILRLGFSYGENQGLDFKAKTTILEIQDLKLPSDKVDSNTYSDADRKALCLMISLGRFCEMFGKRDAEQKTAVYFTEAWVFSKSIAGKAIISDMARVGRSQMNQLILDTQFIGDLGDDDEKGNFGMIFAFDEDSEREKILKHVGLEVNEENLSAMKRMIKGQCWFLDVYGRIGKINIHCPFEEIREALRTTTKTGNSENEESSFND